MPLKFTADTLRAAYAFLDETPPFNSWNLPDAEEVIFRVTRSKSDHGWHDFKNGHHTIALSRITVGSTLNLVMTMAHEMVHIREWQLQIRGEGHGAAFRKLAQRVCEIHGFDPTMF